MAAFADLQGTSYEIRGASRLLSINEGFLLVVSQTAIAAVANVVDIVRFSRGTCSFLKLQKPGEEFTLFLNQYNLRCLPIIFVSEYRYRIFENHSWRNLMVISDNFIFCFTKQLCVVLI